MERDECGSKSNDVATTTPQRSFPYDGQGLKTGEIRLLQAKWSKTSQTLVLRTKVVKLSRRPEFDAVSYVWGTQEPSINVECNEKQVKVTPTVFKMLQYVCRYRPDQKRYFWVDAICINQEDAKEKAMQIPLMQDIYAKATLVVVWMGPSRPETLRFMADFPRVQQLSLDWKPPTGVKLSHWRGKTWPTNRDAFWLGFFHLLNNDWFRRLWTLQEIALAKEAIIMCGSGCIDADDFLGFVSRGSYGDSSYIYYDAKIQQLVPHNPPLANLALSSCEDILRIRDARQDGACGIACNDLSYSLHYLRTRHVQEEVDRVWAINGLTDDRVRTKMMHLIDYSIKGRAEYWRTHTEFAKAIITQADKLNILNIPRSTLPRSSSMPSWCPDLSGRPVCDMLFDGQWNHPIKKKSIDYHSILYAEDDEERSAARRAAMLQHPSKFMLVADEDDIIHINGAILDTVREVVEEPKLLGSIHFQNSFDWLECSMDNPIHAAAVRQLERSLNLARKTYYGHQWTHRNIPPEYIMAFYIDCRLESCAETAYRDLMLALKTEGQSEWRLQGTRGVSLMASVYLFRNTVGRSYFSTYSGRFGTAYAGVKPGDKVCILYGGEALYIIRWPDSEDSADHAQESKDNTDSEQDYEYSMGNGRESKDIASPEDGSPSSTKAEFGSPTTDDVKSANSSSVSSDSGRLSDSKAEDRYKHNTGANHGNGPARFVGAAFIPHLTEAHQAEAARLGPDELFAIR